MLWYLLLDVLGDNTAASQVVCADKPTEQEDREKKARRIEPAKLTGFLSQEKLASQVKGLMQKFARQNSKFPKNQHWPVFALVPNEVMCSVSLDAKDPPTLFLYRKMAEDDQRIFTNPSLIILRPEGLKVLLDNIEEFRVFVMTVETQKQFLRHSKTTMSEHMEQKLLEMKPSDVFLDEDAVLGGVRGAIKMQVYYQRGSTNASVNINFTQCGFKPVSAGIYKKVGGEREGGSKKPDIRNITLGGERFIHFIEAGLPFINKCAKGVHKMMGEIAEV